MEGNGKEYYDNGEYYIGQFKYNAKDGKGVYYNSKGLIKYEGDLLNDEMDGYGKFYYLDDEKYEGQFKKSSREGIGKLIFKDGDYYIGEYKNNKRNGKGKEYYKNGNIKYEGEFVDDEKEGNGKYIYGTVDII